MNARNPRASLRNGLVVGSGLVTLVLAMAGQSIAFQALLPGTNILAEVILGFNLLLLTILRPQMVVPLGLIIPLAPLYTGSSLPVYGGALILLAALGHSWHAVRKTERRCAYLIGVLGLTTLLIDQLVTAKSPSALGIKQAIFYSTLLGCTVAVVKPTVRIIVYSVGALGSLAAVATITTPGLLQARSTVVLGANANGAGFLAALGLVSGLMMTRQRRSVDRFVGIGVVVLCGIGLFDTGSRGAALAALAGSLVTVFRRPLAGSPVKGSITAAALAIGLGYVASPAMKLLLDATGRAQLGTGAGFSFSSRQSALSYAIGQGIRHPWAGVGIGRLSDVSHADPNSGLGLSAHNAFAGIFAESGIIPLTCLVLLSVLALLRSRSPAAGTLLPCAVAVLVGGVSLQWWGDGVTGPVAVLILAAAAAASGTDVEVTDEKSGSSSFPAHVCDLAAAQGRGDGERAAVARARVDRDHD